MIEDSTLSRILDMHEQLMANKDVEIQKLAQDYLNMRDELNRFNVGQQYSLEMITVAYTLAKESPGKKIQVIKNVRDRFGLSLKDSKDLVDIFMDITRYPNSGEYNANPSAL